MSHLYIEGDGARTLAPEDFIYKVWRLVKTKGLRFPFEREYKAQQQRRNCKSQAVECRSWTRPNSTMRKEEVNPLRKYADRIHTHSAFRRRNEENRNSPALLRPRGRPERTDLGNFRYYRKCLAKVFQSV
jgi:hypothetical protein